MDLPEPLYILVQFVLLFMEVLQIAMFVRAIMSWFVDGDNKLSQFLFVLTEPAIMPLRKLFVKMNWFQDTPIDMSFSFTMIGLLLVQLLLTMMI